jgi:hypothetical protein
MKNVIAIPLFLSIFLVGCFTTPNINKNTSTSWVLNNDSLEKAKLSKNEITYRDNPEGLPGGIEIDLFGKISWFNSLMEAFGLHESLTFEDKETLFNALFGFIPADPTSDYYRAIAIGEYLSDRSPLVLYARVYEPSDKAPIGSKGILQFTGNFAVIRNTQTGKIDFRPLKGIIIPNMNWSTAGIIFSDNIIKASYLFSPDGENRTKEDAGDNIYLQYVNLADNYINDEIKDNDDKALEMLQDAYNNATDLTIKIGAKLNTFLYYLYKNDVTNAENALTVAVQLSKEVIDLDPSFKRVIDIEAPTMLRIYKNGIKN